MRFVHSRASVGYCPFRDRKSTRLNSSHDQISYAVFCLKKKTQEDGLELLRAALAANPQVLVVMMTGNPSVESSVEALREGAWDYLPKPFSATHLQILIGRAAHTLLVAQETEEQQVEGERLPAGEQGSWLPGETPAFHRA